MSTFWTVIVAIAIPISPLLFVAAWNLMHRLLPRFFPVVALTAFASLSACCVASVETPDIERDAGIVDGPVVYAHCTAPPHGNIYTVQEPDGSWSCLWGDCQIGWADCDGNPENGCEADLTLPRHCGTCQLRCDPGGVCGGGLSGIGTCSYPGSGN